MKKETKKLVEKAIIFFSPVFTLIMYMLPWMCIYKESSDYKGYVIDNYTGNGLDLEWHNYIDVLKSQGNVFAKVIMYISLVGVIASLVLYVLSVVLKNREKLFTKVGAITLVSSTGILFLTTFASLFPRTAPTGAKVASWIDFMTLPYGFLIVYNVACLIYIVKKYKSNKSK